MTPISTSSSSFFTQIDAIAPVIDPDSSSKSDSSELTSLMREMIAAQHKQTAVLEEMLAQMVTPHRRKMIELALWKRANPELADFCHRAASKLERIQCDLLAAISEEVEYNADTLLDSEFGLSEFLDRFGSKFVHLNTLLQVLAQLGNAPDIQLHPTDAQPNERSKRGE
ncbi:MAG: hypothetical protein ACRCUY_11555 [Thermoguttaceae bacterium]